MSPNKTHSYEHRKHFKANKQEGKHWKPSSEHHQKKNAEGHFILSRNKSGTLIAVSAAIYDKWLHQLRIIVGKETPKLYGLTQGNQLPPIQMPAPPADYDNIIANQDYQADRKEARDKMTKRESDLAVMRTNIVATTGEDWLRWMD